jgi:hypothetical protein
MEKENKNKVFIVTESTSALKFRGKLKGVEYLSGIPFKTFQVAGFDCHVSEIIVKDLALKTTETQNDLLTLKYKNDRQQILYGSAIVVVSSRVVAENQGIYFDELLSYYVDEEDPDMINEAIWAVNNTATIY